MSEFREFPGMSEQTIRDRAWVGDAVLSLYARGWILSNLGEPGVQRGEVLTWFTSNQFLSVFGEPTKVEAKIGSVYEEQGLQAAFDFIEDRILPMFLKQLPRKMQQSKLKSRR